MQMVVIEEVAAEPVAASSVNLAKPIQTDLLFAGLSDHELMSLGVPQEMLSSVRKINVEADLDGTCCCFHCIYADVGSLA